MGDLGPNVTPMCHLQVALAQQAAQADQLRVALQKVQTAEATVVQLQQAVSTAVNAESAAAIEV